VAGAAGRGDRARPGRSVGGVPASEGTVAVHVGAGGAVPRRARGARSGQRPEGDLGGAIRVGGARGNDVALGAGEGVAGLQVEGVGAHGAGGDGRLTLGAPGRRGREPGIQRRVGSGRVAVTGGAGQAGDVDLAVHVRGEVDGGRGVSGVAASAVRAGADVGMGCCGRQAVAGPARIGARLRPDRRVGGVAAHEAAVAVGGRARRAVPERSGAAGRGERAEGEVDLSVGVGGGGGDRVALGAGDGRADGAVLEVKLVGADRAGRGVGFSLGAFWGCGRKLRIGGRRLPRTVSMAQGASFASTFCAAACSAVCRGAGLAAGRYRQDRTCQNQEAY